MTALSAPCPRRAFRWKTNTNCTRPFRRLSASRSRSVRSRFPLRFFLAPLAGYTSLAFRLAVRSCGGLGLATTDLVNARSLIEQRRRALELAETCVEDRPLAIQLYGHVIPEIEQAARWVEAHGATIVDINMGCPVRKVVRGGGGSALLCQVDRAVELVGAVVRADLDPGHCQDAAGLGRRIADRAGLGPRVRAGGCGRGDRARQNAQQGFSGA